MSDDKQDAMRDYKPTLGRHFDPSAYNSADPDPWLALYLDMALPIDEAAKKALLRGNDSYSRRYFLPAARPFIYIFYLMVKIFRRFFPRWPQSAQGLHNLIYWGLKNFASPEANQLIMRHFNIGTEILNFIKDNVPGVEIETVPLKPLSLADLKDNVFLQHDLNIYNFIIELNKGLREQGREIETPERVNFSSISDSEFDFEEFPDGVLNFVDVQTAIEFYTPVYALFLSRHDFVRASNSLQLDETIGIYLARILGTDYHMSLINNHHPMVPLSTFQAGFRLMMHGYDAEALHGYLREMKRRQGKSDLV